MQLPLPLLKNVVLVGGGHAHALVLREWAMKPVAGARLTVINPEPTAPYTGMLPGYVAGHYTRKELDIDLVSLARFADTRLILGSATHVDRKTKTVTVPGRPPIPYDICSIDIGITGQMPMVPGFAEHAVPAKPLDHFATAWTDFVEQTRAEHPNSSRRIVVIGGGIGGSELAMAMQYRLSTIGPPPMVTIVDSGTILKEVGEKARVDLIKALDDRGIFREENSSVVEVTSSGVVTDDGSFIDADFVVGVAGARPYEWLSNLDLQTHEGFISIDDTLRSVTDKSIFAVGDCAHMGFDPRPKAGVFAVRQAPYLTKNVTASLKGGKFEHFVPQTDYLKLVSLGKKSAGADKYGRFVSSDAMWKLKDKIDRDFMDKLNDLPAMTIDPPPKNSVRGLGDHLDQEPPLCGGCGAKVGLDVLAGPLGQLPPSERTDVSSLPGDDAALLHFGSTSQVVTTDTVRAFTPDPFRMARIATLHAMGDAWAMGAAPQAVLVTVTLPQLGRGLQEEWLGEIMAGTTLSLADTGAEIVGGHTSMGAELSLGYTITGLVDNPITLAGAMAGQRLVLSRPIGSGVLFAGEMQLKANGRDVAELLNTLEQPQGKSSEVLVNAGATAMTDVTGFGLAGHLHGILKQSSKTGVSLGAEIDLDSVPFFNGAIDTVKAGVRSHLYESNAAAVPISHGAADPRIELLFDPQTAGGLLAAVPADVANDVADELRSLGNDAAVIGSLTEGDLDIQVNRKG